MNTFDYYTGAIKKYAVFDGRATRAEFWYFFLFNIIVSFALGFVSGFLEVTCGLNKSVISNLYSLFIFLPSLGLGIRRVHDINKNGWFSIIPFYNLYLFAKKGDAGANKYGNAPAKPAAK
jgi:uncharacterized membrane protein YhaH (DUF805 family)